MGNQNKTGLIGLSGTLEQVGCSHLVDVDRRKVGKQRHTKPDVNCTAPKGQLMQLKACCSNGVFERGT